MDPQGRLPAHVVGEVAMTRTYDIPTPFAAIEGEHGIWTVQGHTPGGDQEWVLIECSSSESAARRLADALNGVVAANWP